MGGGSGILPMVTAQRDRFKKKIGELEQELQKQYQTVSTLRSEVSSLQKDNLNLYEKTRYVSTYNRPTAQPLTSGSAYGANPNPSTIQVSQDTSSGLSLDRYRSTYESNISPFAAFRGRESARALKRMSLPERAVFQITRLVLQTRTSRNLFAMYCLALHLLVFTMLYWMGSVDVEQHASNLGAGAGAAVAGVGGTAAHGDWTHDDFDQAG
jgi:homeobox protein cut-like